MRRNLGYHAGSDQGFYARLTGRENLRFFGRLSHLHGADLEQRIASMADQFCLRENMDRQVRTLSSGTIQRLSLLRALLHEPPVVLLDEPTRSLDAIAAAELRHFLKTEILHKRGATLLFASHTLPEIEFLADRVAILHEGTLLAMDSPATLKKVHSCASLQDVFAQLTGHAIHLPEDSQFA